MYLRKITSFVKRSGRLTEGQRKGLTDLWPRYGLDIEESPINIDHVFKNNHPITIEIGFGNGDTLIEMAENYPERNFIGIEVYEAGIGRTINEANKRKLENLKIINGDAVEVFKNNIPNESFDRLQLFFPDPWHKKRHHKRRIVSEEFLDMIAKKLKIHGIVHMATDWENYAQHMMTTLETHKNFKNLAGDHKYSLGKNFRPITKFEKRGNRLGHGVWDLLFERNL